MLSFLGILGTKKVLLGGAITLLVLGMGGFEIVQYQKKDGGSGKC